MSRPSRRASWVALAASAATLVALFFLSCEKRAIEIPRGYSGEAARNAYLAAQRLLERLGTPVRSFADLSGLAELPPEDGTLIVPTARRALGKARARDLLDWVERGGHLVVVSWQLFDDPEREPDLVLDPIGVRQYLNESSGEEPEREAPESDAPSIEPPPRPPAPQPPARPPVGPPPLVTMASNVSDEEEPPGPEVALVYLPDRELPLEVEFDPAFRFEVSEAANDTAVFEIADANGAHLVTVRRGQGYVTALTDDYFLTQPKIADWDHAELVYRLAHFAGRAGPVWIVFGDDYPGALALVLRHAWMVVVSALVLLALWLWSASRRFGPLAPDPPRERRELMEHVRAAGRFQWRRGAAPALLQATRDALFARVRERHPTIASASPAEQAASLAELSGLPREGVARALAFRTDSEASRFAQNVATLEKIRRSL
ncbi:MAG: DUF4350 domain-containing protein [Myxococcota bacterium]